MSPLILFSVKKSTVLRNSLVVQWLGFSVLTARDKVQCLVGELRSHKPNSQKNFKNYKSPQSLTITSLMPTHTHTHTHTHTWPKYLANQARTGSQKQQKHQHLQELASHHTSQQKDMTLPFLSPPLEGGLSVCIILRMLQSAPWWSSLSLMQDPPLFQSSESESHSVMSNSLWPLEL